MAVSILAAAIIRAHSFYSQECCHNKDCHPVPCSQVQSTRNGWIWNGITFLQKMLRHSEDGNCHVCISISPLCIYLPEQT